MPNIIDKLNSDPGKSAFFELSDEDQERYLNEILLYANSNKKEIILYCLNTEPTLFCNLDLVYEALARDSGNWGDFIFEEYKRIFEGAKSSPVPFQYTACLDVGLYFEDKSKPFADK